METVHSADAPSGRLRARKVALNLHKEIMQCRSPMLYGMPVPPNGWPLYGVNAQCVHNELRALQYRTIVPLPSVEAAHISSLLKVIHAYLPMRTLRPLSDEELLSAFPQRRRRLYRRFVGSLVEDVGPSRSRVQAFTKVEKIPIVKRGKVKAPRLIQARHPAFNWQLAKFTRPIEHSLYGLKLHGMRVFAKGLNLAERANLIVQAFQQIVDPVALSLDATDWDGHCGPCLIEVEHQYYLERHGYHPVLAHLLKQQLSNRGRTRCGLTYTVRGGRMSGDMNTALGNCILASALALGLLVSVAPEALAQKRAHIICDGDDTIIIAQRSLVHDLCEVGPSYYAQYGHKLRVDNVTDKVHLVEFCQHKPLRLHDGTWVMCPNPRKVLQTAFMATGRNAFNMAYYGTLWDARARIHAGTPVYQELFGRLARENPARLDHDIYFGFEHADPGLPAQPIDNRTRLQFAEAWDFDLEEQAKWENAQVRFIPDAAPRDPTTYAVA